MALANRVKETSTTTGTGTLDLDGAVSEYQTFVAGLGESTDDTTGPWAGIPYLIKHSTLDEWEMGHGTVTDGSPDTLTRSPDSSSTGGSLVNFSAGSKIVVLAPGYKEFPREWVVNIEVTTDQPIASDDTEDLLDANLTVDKDDHGLYDSGIITAPFDGIMTVMATFIRDDSGAATAGSLPNVEIETVSQVNYSAVTSTAPDAPTLNTLCRMFEVSKDDAIVIQGTNVETDAARNVSAGSYISLSFREGSH